VSLYKHTPPGIFWLRVADSLLNNLSKKRRPINV